MTKKTINNDDYILDGMKQSFEEVSAHYDAHLNSVKVLRETNKQMFTSASLFVTIAVSLNLFTTDFDPNFSNIRYVLLVLLLIIFLCVYGVVDYESDS